MDLSSHHGITLILLGRSTSVCTLSFDGLKSPLLKKCFSDLNLYEAVMSCEQLKLQCLLMKPTHDDIIKAKEVYIQLSLEVNVA